MASQTRFSALLRRRWDTWILYPSVLSLVLVLHVPVFWLLHKRSFSQDEFLHVHAAWCMLNGLLPYRDYFDHYTPLFRLFLVPLFHFFNVETDVSDAIRFLFFSRELMWLISSLILLLTFWLG